MGVVSGFVIMESLGVGLGDAAPSEVTCGHFRKAFLKVSTGGFIQLPALQGTVLLVRHPHGASK